jgi:choline dehydrogenase
MRALIEGIRMARRIGEASAFSDWNEGEYFPGPRVDDDDGLADYVRSTVSTWFHPVGTCRMGVDDRAVVGPDLRVHGVEGLRVADASVMPDIPSVNTNAASTMIGWRAGGLILGEAD